MKTFPIPLLLSLLLLAAASLFAQEKPDAAPAEKDDSARQAIIDQLNGIIIPQVKFRDINLPDAMAFFHRKSVELSGADQGDATEQAPSKATPGQQPGPNKQTQGESQDFAGTPKFTVWLKNIPLSEALRYTADLGGVQFTVDADGVHMLPRVAGVPAKPNESLLPAKAQEEGRKSIAAKLDRIILPNLELHGATLGEVLAYIEVTSVRLDVAETDPARKGVNIVLKTGALPGDGKPPDGPRIGVSMTNVSEAKALQYIAGISGMKITIDPCAVVLEPDTAAKKESPPPQ